MQRCQCPRRVIDLLPRFRTVLQRRWLLSISPEVATSDLSKMKPLTPLLPLLPARKEDFPVVEPKDPSASGLLKSSLHVFPAAFPRSRKGSAVFKPYQRKERPSKSQVEAEAKEILDGNYNAPVSDLKELDQPQLYISAKRYRPKQASTKGIPLTLITSHANGFHKESWEPLLEEMMGIQSDTYRIEEVWSLDIVNQGDSAVLNKARLGRICECTMTGYDQA
jgi:hypothetical protein